MLAKHAFWGVAILLAACSDGGESRVALDQVAVTPDEFNIMPQKPLQQPLDYRSLPEPTPGAANLADIDPKADLAAALGG